MRPSFWMKTASYFADIQVEIIESSYSGTLEVICRNGRYALCSSNAVYSYEDLYVNFDYVFEHLELEAYQLKNVLILGLGLGSIPWLLEKKFNKNYNYVFVEIDQKIIDSAKHYALSELESTHAIFCQDAFTYIKECTQKFDMIIVDLFIDNIVPSTFESLEFLYHTKRLLCKDGLLLYNRLADTADFLERTNSFYEQEFKKVYPKAINLSVGTNKMLINNYKPSNKKK